MLAFFHDRAGIPLALSEDAHPKASVHSTLHGFTATPATMRR